MERKATENFQDYKSRRAVSNLAVKNINKDSKGGTRTSRQMLRDSMKQAGSKLGGYGAIIRAHFDSKRAQA